MPDSHVPSPPGYFEEHLNRRTVLRVLGGMGLATVVAACGGGGASSASGAGKPSSPSGASTSSTSANPLSDSTGGTSTCVLAPEMTEGPFYLDINEVRSDITEGHLGVPLALTLTVIDATTCKPVTNAAVDVWHTTRQATTPVSTGHPARSCAARR